MAQAKQSLLRALTLTDSIALVIGTVIGTGVFLKTAPMTQQLSSPVLVPLAWLAAALLSLAGALAYAELGAMFPDAGGEYVYIGKAFGDAPAFLYGRMQFAVAGAGAIGGLSIGLVVGTDELFHALWSDTRTGLYQLWTASIKVTGH